MTPRITLFLLVLLVAACASPQAPTSMLTKTDCYYVFTAK